MLKQRSFWVPVVCGILILGLGSGTRQSFGIFQMAIVSADVVGYSRLVGADEEGTLAAQRT